MDKIVPYLHYVPHAQLLSVQFNVTNRCFSRCNMCMKWKNWPKNDLLTTDDLLRVIADCKALGVQSIVLSGGEPFARTDLLEIAEHKGSMALGVLTSGIWDDSYSVHDVVDAFDLIHFSFDALDPELYEAIRGVPMADVVKQRLIDVARCIHTAELRTQLKVNIVKQRLNADHIAEVVAFCRQRGIPYRVSPVHTFDSLKAGPEVNKKCSPAQCVVPYFHCVIDADGLVFPCCHLLNDNDSYLKSDRTWAYGSVLCHRFYQIWGSKQAQITRGLLFDELRPEECEQCDNRYIHINSAFAEYDRLRREVVFL